MRLGDVRTGAHAVLEAPDVPAQMARRLAELGLRAGESVQVMHRTAGGGRLLAVGDTRIAIDRQTARRSRCARLRPTPRADRGGSAVSAPAPDRPSARSTRSVPSCHSEASAWVGSADAPVVALVGSPNVGKSTLFNALTGLRRDVGNWPGTTVAVGRGVLGLPERRGGPAGPARAPTASTRCPRTRSSPGRCWSTRPRTERPDVVVVTARPRTCPAALYLLAQLRETDTRLVLAVTMTDVAARRGVSVDPDALAAAVGVPVVDLDPRRGEGVRGLAARSTERSRAPPPTPRQAGGGDDPLAVADARFTWIATAVEPPSSAHAVGRSDLVGPHRPRRHGPRSAGPLVFLAVMWLVFQITTTVAAPMQEALDAFVTGPVASAATWVLDVVGLGDTWVTGLVVDGLIAGVGMLLTFVPLMALMFALLSLLEDSGYMARAAVVTDRLMRRIGLPGRAFLPLVVGFGCNVPAIGGTRVLPDARHRLLTALLVPFTSCTRPAHGVRAGGHDVLRSSAGHRRVRHVRAVASCSSCWSGCCCARR